VFEVKVAVQPMQLFAGGVVLSISFGVLFIATLGDFLGTMARQERFHPDFEDALAVQRVLDALERSASSRSWVALGA
jgi:hypothetical protein